jgi:competence protein ComEC
VFPAAVGLVLSLSAPPPDLLISADGRHLALLLGAGEVGAERLAMLRERNGSYIRDMRGNAAAAPAAAPADAALADLPRADCSQDTCVADTADIAGRGRDHGNHWRLLATLSKDLVDRADFAPVCEVAEIVVSDRKMPTWYVPRWLMLDRDSPGRRGAMAISLCPRRIESVGATTGDHPWMPQAVQRRPYVCAGNPAVGTSSYE